MALAGVDGRAHELAAGRLVGRLDLQQPLEVAAAAQQLGQARVHPTTDVLGPARVQRVGQQLAGARRRHRGAARRVAGAQGVGRAAQERLDVRGDHPLGEQLHGAAPQDDGLPGAKRPPGMVGGLAQVRRSGPGIEVRPEVLEHAVAREPPVVGKRQQRHELLRTPRPVRGGDAPAIAPHAQTAEQLDVDGAGWRGHLDRTTVRHLLFTPSR